MSLYNLLSRGELQKAVDCIKETCQSITLSSLQKKLVHEDYYIAAILLLVKNPKDLANTVPYKYQKKIISRTTDYFCSGNYVIHL